MTTETKERIIFVAKKTLVSLLLFVLIVLCPVIMYSKILEEEESQYITWATLKMLDGKIIEGEAEEVLHYIRFVDVTIDGETHTVNKSDVAFTKKKISKGRS